MTTSAALSAVQFNVALRPHKPLGLLGTGAQDGHLDFHSSSALLCRPGSLLVSPPSEPPQSSGPTASTSSAHVTKVSSPSSFCRVWFASLSHDMGMVRRRGARSVPWPIGIYLLVSGSRSTRCRVDICVSLCMSVAEELHPWRFELEMFPGRLTCGNPYRQEFHPWRFELYGGEVPVLFPGPVTI